MSKKPGTDLCQHLRLKSGRGCLCPAHQVVSGLQQDLRKLQQRLGITFKQQGLLKQAFTHASYVNEQRVSRETDNERIEYLGDAVLELAVSEFLYRQYPSLPEGELTKLRASIVCEASLVHFAEELDFGSYVFLGRGEEMTGGRMRPALLADVYEAFIGALYLDQGMQAVVLFLENSMFPRLSDEGKPHFFDYKTQLQEIAQQHNLGAVEYRIIEERGPAHERQFVSQVFVNQECVGQGTGRSKKEAEQQAADQAVQRIQLQRSNRTVSGE